MELPQKDVLERGPVLRILQAAVDTLMDGAPPDLTAFVSMDLPDVLKGAARPQNAEAPATVDEFLERFRRRAGLDRGDVLHEAQVAIALVCDMMPEETVEDLRASLPPRFGILFRRGPAGRPSRRPR